MNIVNFEPVKIDTSIVVDEERDTLFWIDDEEYTIPKKIKPNITMKYFNDVLEKGESYAIAAAMDAVLGTDAMEALAECDAVSDEHMEQIMAVVEKKLVGAQKKQLKNSRGAHRR